MSIWATKKKQEFRTLNRRRKSDSYWIIWVIGLAVIIWANVHYFAVGLGR